MNSLLFRLFYTWNTMLGWQSGPAKEIGPTKNLESEGTRTVDDWTLQAAAHADWNACIGEHQLHLSLIRISKHGNVIIGWSSVER